MILDQFDAGGRAEKIDRPALIKSDRWAFQPLLGLRLRAEDIRRLGKDLGELPGPAALFLAERLGQRVLPPLPGAQAHADRFFQRFVLAYDDKIADKVIER